MVTGAIKCPFWIAIEGKRFFDPGDFGLFELFGRWNEVGATCE